MAQVAPHVPSAAPAKPFALPPVYVPLAELGGPVLTADTAAEVVELDRHVFAAPVRRDILHLCVVQHLDGLRQGSANTKTRGEVRGSGRKIRPQKGTGHARLGDGQSPMLRGGGVAFGPKPRDFSTQLPRKVRALGMRVALSARLKDAAFAVVRSLAPNGVGVRTVARVLERSPKTLFVTGAARVDPVWTRALEDAQLKRCAFVAVRDLDVYALVKWPRVVLDVDAVDVLERNLSKLAVGPMEIKALGAPPVKDEPSAQRKAQLAQKPRVARKWKWAVPKPSDSRSNMFEEVPTEA
jgi:large subunit ribosomal protein L4